MSVSLHTLLHKSFINAVLGPHLLEEFLIENGLIYTNFHTLRDFFLRMIDAEPFMLFNLFYSETEIGIRDQNVKD